MNDKYPYKTGDHNVICDICGRKRYRSECRFTWDGFLACITSNCWYPKDPLFIVPPVINDPRPLYDVRPDVVTGQETSVYSSNRSNWGTFVDLIQTTNNPVIWNLTPQTWGNINPNSPNYISSTF